MKILIHTRHAELQDDFKSLVNEKLLSMDRFSVVIERVEVEVIGDANPHQGKHKRTVVLTSHGAGPLLRAEAQEFSDVAAFDTAVMAFGLQIRKLHERTKDYDRKTIRKMKITN